jgi:ABC-type transporter Mla subunit MlaD
MLPRVRRETLRFVVLAIVALLVIGLVLATTADPSEPAGTGSATATTTSQVPL